MARAQYGDQDMVGNRVVNLGDGVERTDAATLAQADEVVVSLEPPTDSQDLWVALDSDAISPSLMTVSRQPPSGSGYVAGHVWIQY